MKYFYSFLSLVLMILIFTSCQKKRTLTFEGRLFKSCNTPAANKEFSIRTSTFSPFSYSPDLVLNFTTDDEGYFKVTHTEDSNISKFTVVVGAREVLYVHYYPEDHKKLGNMYISFPTNFIINLDVQNPYTENDTLVMHDFSSSDPFAEKLFPGPFESGFLDSVVNHPYDNFPISWQQQSEGNLPKYSISYHFRNETGYNGHNETVSFDTAPICSDEYAEVSFVIE
ncbi:MAG: hypothetical protein WED10_10110 [Brumimicrobium sp.]